MKALSLFRGLTLIELLVAIVILALLIGLATSSWTASIGSLQHRSAVNDTLRAFSLARSYAISRNTLTTICPLSSDRKCNNAWNETVYIFPDADNDRRPDNARVYRSLSLARGQSSIFSRTAGRGYFQLGPDGMSHGTMGSLVIHSPGTGRQTLMTYIALNIGGRLRVLQDQDRDGVIKLPWGTVIRAPTR